VLVGKITDACRKLESEWAKQCEDMIGKAGGVGVGVFDSKLGFVIVESTAATSSKSANLLRTRVVTLTSGFDKGLT
jgi:hypothetical protein